MNSMDFFIIIVIALVLLIFILTFIKNITPSPDPWEKEISKDEVDKLEQEICLKCGTGVKTGQYYCPKCNNATGKYVPYLPFVNIPFNYSMHQTLWQKLKSKDVNFLYKAIAILFIILTAPIMIVGFFFYLIIKGIFKIYSAIIKRN